MNEDSLKAQIKDKLAEYGEWMMRLQIAEDRVATVKKEIQSLDTQFTQLLQSAKKVRKKKKEDAAAHA